MDNSKLVNEDTLPDDAWKDSFDKLLDQRPVLRELNIIKRDIRVSFNMNSSYENSSGEIASLQDVQIDCIAKTPKTQYLNVPKAKSPKKVNRRLKVSNCISTPQRDSITSNPFKCTLSPIGIWELQYINNNNNNQKEYRKTFNATAINDNIVANVEYIDEPSLLAKEKQSRYSMDLSPLAIVREKWKAKQKQVCFATNTVEENHDKSIEVVEPGVTRPAPEAQSNTHNVSLHPGKWRKSLCLLRRTQIPKIETDKNHIISKQSNKGRSTGVIGKSKAQMNTTSIAGQRKSIFIRPTSINKTPIASRSTFSLGTNDFKRQILQRCGQRRVLTFNVVYNADYLKNCQKIGEGAFGEVFLYSNPEKQNHNNDEGRTVLKIIPIEGKQLVNGEVQKTFEQILPEVIISMELCSLNDNRRKTNLTSGYVNLQRVRCIKGEYPEYLQKLWEEYDSKKESENDHPECFTISQHYIVLELAFSGQDLEGFTFKNAEQSYYALQQIVLTLAVGESEYQFEHRDLHWGNVLILNTNQQYISYKLDGEDLTLDSKGVQITIIDYTLSRLTVNDYFFYNDLSNDEELFSATGDYQFEIYRMMRQVLNDKWETFEPKTNIFWISYIISKMLDGVSYKNIRSKLHLQYIGKLKELQTTILTYKSCVDFAKALLTN